MRLLYKKHIFLRKLRKIKKSFFREANREANKGDELRNYMKKIIKDRVIKNIRINIAGCLNRCNLGSIMILYFVGICIVQSKNKK
tara:strand:+ start:490 stop:744 length:255 start_codon:yes stop_codon:yes gene_type:complete